MPVIAYLPAAGNLATWLWQNRAGLGDAFAPIADRVEHALGSSRPEIQRIGSAIVSIRDDQTQVLGLLHQHNAQLGGIAEAVAGLTTGQAVLGQSLDALRHLSMLSLGVSVASLGVSTLALGVLLHQFHQLNRHVAELGRQIRRVRDLVAAQQLAVLTAGLTQLQQGVEAVAAGRVEEGRTVIGINGVNNLTISVNTHAVLLDGELRAARPERPVVRELFRHLAVALMGEAGCHLALGHAASAVAAIRGQVGLAERYAREVFAQTVGAEPARFLCPALARHGVTIEFLAELFRQASHAGAVEGRPAVTAADVLEEWRARLHTARDPFRASTVTRMRTDLAEAVSAIEEVNRVKGFATVLAHYISAGEPYDLVLRDMLDEIARARPAVDSYLAYFRCPPGPGPTQG